MACQQLTQHASTEMGREGEGHTEEGEGKVPISSLIKKVEKGVAARVPVAEVRAYVARLIEEDGHKVATGRTTQQKRQQSGEGRTPRIPELATQASRQDMIKIGKGGSNGEWARLRHVMRKWVHEQKWGAVHMNWSGAMGEGVLSPPLVLRAVKGLGKRGTTADEVRSTMAMLAYEEEWIVGWWKGK